MGQSNFHVKLFHVILKGKIRKIIALGGTISQSFHVTLNCLCL
jgi:hypothetical protein